MGTYSCAHHAHLNVKQFSSDPLSKVIGMQVYHGTSTGTLHRAASNGGLVDPFVTPCEDIAWYYAEQAAEVDGTIPTVVTLDVNESQLRYDGAAMDEPVMASDDTRDAAWNTAAAEHPEWLQNGYIVVPSEAWSVSWTGVQSAWHDGPVTEWTET